MAWVIKSLGPFFDGQYLAHYDAEGNDGYGDFRFSADRAQAKRYADVKDLLEDWTRVPANRPTRDDGKPNKPLTAFSFTPERVEEDS